MSGYKPPQRTVDCTILTTAGFITAELSILEKGLVVDQLEAVAEFYHLTHASLVGVDTKVEFLALQRNAILYWVPKGEPDDMLQRPIQPAQRERVFVLFDGGAVLGDLEWREHVPLSNFVTKQDGYMLLRDCEVMVGHADRDKARRAAAVILNVNHVVGISTQNPI